MFNLIEQFAVLENHLIYLLIGAAVASISCLTHYFYLLVVGSIPEVYLYNGKLQELTLLTFKMKLIDILCSSLGNINKTQSSKRVI